MRWIGKAGATDRQLMKVVLDGNWTFVTKNSIDFRGPAAVPGATGQYRAAVLHAGLICLNGPVGMGLDLQVELFETALDELERDADLVNCVLEVTLEKIADGQFKLVRYALPKP